MTPSLLPEGTGVSVSGLPAPARLLPVPVRRSKARDRDVQPSTGCAGPSLA
ncbi:hypothetical protein ACWGVR_01290 [Streptomyces xanthophaeus]